MSYWLEGIVRLRVIGMKMLKSVLRKFMPAASAEGFNRQPPPNVKTQIQSPYPSDIEHLLSFLAGRYLGRAGSIVLSLALGVEVTSANGGIETSVATLGMANPWKEDGMLRFLS